MKATNRTSGNVEIISLQGKITIGSGDTQLREVIANAAIVPARIQGLWAEFGFPNVVARCGILTPAEIRAELGAGGAPRLGPPRGAQAPGHGQRDDVVEALAPEGADHPFGHGIRTRGAHRGEHGVDTEGLGPGAEGAAGAAAHALRRDEDGGRAAPGDRGERVAAW